MKIISCRSACLARVSDSAIVQALFLLPLSLFLSCESIPPNDNIMPIPDSWGPNTYQVDAQYENGSTSYYTQISLDGQLTYSPDPISATELPFQFYTNTFENFQEIIISSPYPIRPNWFQVSKADCVDSGNSSTGIEFAITTAREKDYLLIARLDSTYWECLKASTTPLNFSFQILDTHPITPTKFTLQGFYNQLEELVYLKATCTDSGVWHTSNNYQVFQEPGSKDFSIHISKHPQLGVKQLLLRISSSMQILPHSLWIGLDGECLDQADWEVHTNRHYKEFLLDVIIPDCYLDCLKEVADGFEFEVEFFQ